MKADKPLGKAEREAINGKKTSQRIEANFPEAELPAEDAWEKERKTALAQIQNALKFCVQS